MQLKKLSPLAGLILTGLLSACGGKGDEPPPPAAPPPPPAITVSALSLNSTTPKPYATDALQFDGGVCSGGTGALTAAWDFGDGNGSGAYAPHTYLDSVAGTHTVTVTCTDTAGTTAGVATLQLNVLSAAMKGFLGRSWTPYAALETNVSPYPVVGITSTDDIFGVWVRRNGNNANEVATGQTAFNQNIWTVGNTILATAADQSPYFDAATDFTKKAPIDMAVSANGHGLAAWMAGSSIYYATKAQTGTTWATPVPKLTTPVGETLVNKSIKVVVNNSGNGAIAYCTEKQVTLNPVPALPALPYRIDVSAYVNPYTGGSASGTPKKISTRCDVLDSFADNNTLNAFQRHRAFDIAIDKDSKLVVVGVQPATSNASNFAVAVQTYSAGAWSAMSRIVNADELTTAPGTVSLSLSSDESPAAIAKGAIAWSQIDPITTNANVYTSMWIGTGWSAAAAYSHDISPTTTYDRPLIAINKNGDAFMTMRLHNTSTIISATNYNATTSAWSNAIAIDGLSGGGEYRAMDIAIDNWGTGLVTNVDSNFRYSQAGTFAKQAGRGQWSGFKIISSARPDTAYYYSAGFHYQTMRALPEGKAILVTSLYDDYLQSASPFSSGYMMLK